MKKSILFISTLLAAGTLGAFADDSSTASQILINFAQGNGTGTAWGTWNNLANASGSSSSLVFSDNTSASGTSVAWSSNNVWSGGSVSDDSYGFMKGYLDDVVNGASPTITITQNLFLVCNITVIAGTDQSDSNYTAKTINGTAYTYDSVTSATIEGNSVWGQESSSKTPTEGTNMLTISGITDSTIVVSSVQSTSNSARGGIAGIIITDATDYDSLTKITGTSNTWTTSSFAGTSYSASDIAYGYLNSGDATITASLDSTEVGGLAITGSGTLTISGDVTFAENATVRAVSGTTICFDGNATFNGGTILGTITTGAAGKIIVNSGTVSVDSKTTNVLVNENGTVDYGAASSEAITNLSGTGTVAFTSTEHGTVANLNSATDFTGTVSITGKVGVGALGSLGNASLVEISRSDSSSSMWCSGAGTINKSLLFKTDYQIGDNGYNSPNITFAQSVSAATGTTVTLGDSSTTGRTVTATFNVATQFDTLALSQSNNSTITADFAGETTISTLTTSGGTVNFQESATATIGTISSTGTTTFGGAGTVSASKLQTVNGATVNITGGTYTLEKLQLNNESNSNNSSKVMISGDNTVVNVTTTQTEDLDANSGGNSAVVIGHWGGSGTHTLEVAGGTLNVLNGYVRAGWSSNGTFTVSGGEANVYGISITTQPNNAKTGIFNLSGGRVNIGAGGLLGANTNSSFNLSGGTIGALDNWSTSTMSASMTISNTVTIDTTKMEVASGSTTATATSDGATIMLGNVISGTGALNVTGAGTLALTGANTYSGKTTLSAGTLQIQNATATSYTGGIDVTGGTLELAGTNTIAGAVSVSGACTVVNVTGTTTLSNVLTITGSADATDTSVCTSLYVKEGGTVICSDTGGIVQTDGGTSHVEIQSGGTLEIQAIAQNRTVSTLNGVQFASGSTLKTSGSYTIRVTTTSQINFFAPITIDVGTGSTLEWAATTTIYSGSNITGAGTFKVGASTTLALLGATIDVAYLGADVAGTLSVSGGTTISSGTDMSNFAGNISIAATGKLSISSKIGSESTKAAGVTFASGAKLFLTNDWLNEPLTIDTADSEVKTLEIICSSAITVNGTALGTGDVTSTLVDYVEYDDAFEAFNKAWSYNEGSLILTLTAIPEPSMFGLLAGTLALALAGTRRRRKRS